MILHLAVPLLDGLGPAPMPDDTRRTIALAIDVWNAHDEAPIERERLSRWAEDWRHDHRAPARVLKVILDAMARYLADLRARGNSPRALASVRSDLNAAGQLVLMYDAPKGNRILEHFHGPPWELEFERKFTDRPALVARYRRSLEGFADFLEACGDPAAGRGVAGRLHVQP